MHQRTKPYMANTTIASHNPRNRFLTLLIALDMNLSWRRRPRPTNVSITPKSQLGSMDKTVTSGPNARLSMSYASGINTENLTDSVGSSLRDEDPDKENPADGFGIRRGAKTHAPTPPKRVAIGIVEPCAVCTP